MFVCPLITREWVGRLSPNFTLAAGHPGDGVRWVRFLDKQPENWHFSYFWAPAEWAHAYHCSGGTAGLSLRGTGADRPTVREAVENGVDEGWAGL